MFPGFDPAGKRNKFQTGGDIIRLGRSRRQREEGSVETPRTLQRKLYLSCQPGSTCSPTGSLHQKARHYVPRKSWGGTNRKERVGTSLEMSMGKRAQNVTGQRKKLKKRERVVTRLKACVGK